MISEKTTGASALAGRSRWLIQTARGDLFLVDSEAKVRELLGQGRMTAEACVYDLAGRPRVLADVPELARLLPDAEMTEPPIRPDRRSPERAQLSEELAVLNRPLEDDVEYYDELPRSRVKPVLVVIALLALVGGGASVFLLRHFPRANGPGSSAHASASTSSSTLPPRESAGVVATPRPGARAPVEGSEPSAPPAAADGLGDPEPPARTAPPTKVVATPSARSPDQVRSASSYDQIVAAADRLLENGRRKQAENLYRQALTARPGGPEALTGLAYTELDRGRSSKAVSLFKQVLARHRSHAPALFGLGEAYREQGKRALAVEAFKRYLALKSSGRDADMARRQIRQLSS